MSKKIEVKDATAESPTPEPREFHGVLEPCPEHRGFFHLACKHPMNERCETSGLGGGDTVYEDRSSSGRVSSGVNSEAYRQGWERIFRGTGGDAAN